MDLSYAEAKALLELPKRIVINDERLEKIYIPATAAPFNLRHYALSEDGEYSFLLDVSQSAKNNLKIALHFQEDDTRIGLLRIDYSGRHKNPEVINDNVPGFLRPYVGVLFDYEDHHIHYQVQGYPALAWAVPLVAEQFPVKQITNFRSLQEAVLSFAELTNLKTELVIEERLFL